MTDPFEAKHTKAISAKQIKRSLLKPRGTASSSPPEDCPSGLEWTLGISSARESAQQLWDCYLTEDPEIFAHAVKRLAPGAAELRLLLEIAHQARSPGTPSDLGSASASRYAPIKAAIRGDWITAQAQGSKKSKAQFVKDWIHQQAWTAASLKMTEKALYACLPKSKADK